MKNKQSNLLSFFGGNATQSKNPQKENSGNSSDEKKQNDTTSSSKRKPDETSNKQSKRRQVIEDDSSDEEDGKVTMEAVVEMNETNDKEESSPTKKKQHDDSNQKPSSHEKSLKQTPPESKPTTATTKKNSSTSSILKAADKKQFQSDTALLASIPDSWSDRLPYSILCQTFAAIEAISSRIEITNLLTKLLRQVLLRSPQDMHATLYLASNSVAPACQNVELGIGDSLLIKAIGEATGTNADMVKQKYEKEGDLGKVAHILKGKQKTLGGFFGVAKKEKPLTALEVLTAFREIANTRGNQSQKWKVDRIKRLLVRTEGEGTKYIIRGLQGKLRIGLAQSTVLVSLAHALALTNPSTIITAEGQEEYPKEAKQYYDETQPVEKRLEAAVAIVKTAYSEVSSYDALLDSALQVPLQELHKHCKLTPGVPVVPMFAKPTKSIQEVLTRLGGKRFTAEYKYDGERGQVHMLPDGTTKVFSRNLLDTSEKYPEVPAFVKEACKNGKVQSFVLDTEVVAFNNKTGQLVPFQILSTRKKTEESAETAKVQVIVQAFDLMYLNGESLLSTPLAVRRQLLHEHFCPVAGKFQFAISKDLHLQEDGETAVLEEFLDASIKGQCEGLMVKTLDENATYEPSLRTFKWLKLKKDYLEGLGDSFDLVVLGAYHGKGKRTGVYGAYLLACYDADTEEFQSVCKVGTGLKDKDLQELSESLNAHIIPQKSSQYNVSDVLECDVWFDAVQVWEVKAADLSKSSAHRGAAGKTGEEGRGIGLRFPRFERVRDDKKPSDATSSDQILETYYNQDTIVVGDDDDDDDDDIGI